MVSHVPFLVLNTVMNWWKIDNKSVHFVCTYVFYALQASCAKCFSKQLPAFYYWTWTKRLPFYDISDVVQKMFFFLDIIEQFGTRPRRRNTVLLCWSCACVCCLILTVEIHVCAFTAISRKVVGKGARDNPERYCGWFWIHCFSKKFERMTRGAMDVCLRVLKESSKSRSVNYSVRNSVLIISHISGLSRAHFFRQPFSK